MHYDWAAREGSHAAIGRRRLCLKLLTLLLSVLEKPWTEILRSNLRENVREKIVKIFET